MKVYVAMIGDRHCDPEPYVFSTQGMALLRHLFERGRLRLGRPIPRKPRSHRMSAPARGSTCPRRVEGPSS